MQQTHGLHGSSLGENMLRVSAAELIGTFLLVFVGTGAAVSALLNRPVAGLPADSLAVALAFGLVLVALIGALGHISGAHFNPAVTVALAVTGKFPWKYVPAYIGSQVVGAILASFAVLFSFGEQAKRIASLGVTSPALQVTSLQAVGIEALITFLLVFVIISVATDNRVSSAVSGTSIGFALSAAILVGGPLTGAAVNPARAFGPMLVSGQYVGWWIYLVGPTVGAVCAALLYDKVMAPARQPEKAE